MNEYTIYKHQSSMVQELKRLMNSSLPIKTKKQIEEFGQMRLAKGSTKLRVVKCMWCIRIMSAWLNKDFKKATKNDLLNLISTIDMKSYSEYTKYDFKVVLKMFYKWLLGNDEEFPEVIKWMKPKLKASKHKLPEELLTPEEVNQLANATTNPRDKALVLVLYESGCRIGELLYLKLKNVHFDKYGAILRVSGKTGDRRIRIIASVQILTLWLQEHPDKDNPNSPLWPARLGHYKPEPCSYPSLLTMLKRAAKRAKIRKRIYPHLFRHSRATSLANKLTEAQMKEFFGWTQDSGMAATYVHLSGRDVDSALLQMYSLKEKPEEKQQKLDIRFCPRCKEKNSPTQSFCGKCGSPFDEQLILEDPNKKPNDLMNALIKDPEVKEVLLRKITERGLDKEFF
ncbi:tyrosine-type recombinase/integrase [Candidatus Micrarchaeota archaeon]|nr:tyrosine-type recombinase/integrase [Candidatus Micrarchaeota archaeon]MBU1166576.1 tyrosine-type recombinase/integrase [Candidatus Micrarchaeota archaeon]MBU1887292.1 tyrosine-type recombinase/integrase [Candidatus Micrarchaeota archaeon]